MPDQPIGGVKVASSGCDLSSRSRATIAIFQRFDRIVRAARRPLGGMVRAPFRAVADPVILIPQMIPRPMIEAGF
jgi:hypothetical protein